MQSTNFFELLGEDADPLLDNALELDGKAAGITNSVIDDLTGDVLAVLPLPFLGSPFFLPLPRPS